MNGAPENGQDHPEDEKGLECRPDAEDEKRTSITTTTMKKGDYSEKHVEPAGEEETPEGKVLDEED